MTFDPTKPPDLSGAVARVPVDTKSHMRGVSFAHKDTGIFNGGFVLASEKNIALNTPADHIAVDGHHQPHLHRWDAPSGKVVEYTPPVDATADAASVAAAKRIAALTQIERLERGQARAIREASLGKDGAAARLQKIDDQIAGLRSELQ